MEARAGKGWGVGWPGAGEDTGAGTLPSAGREKGGLKIGTAEGGGLVGEGGGWKRGGFTCKVKWIFFFSFHEFCVLSSARVLYLQQLFFREVLSFNKDLIDYFFFVRMQ